MEVQGRNQAVGTITTIVMMMMTTSILVPRRGTKKPGELMLNILKLLKAKEKLYSETLQCHSFWEWW